MKKMLTAEQIKKAENNCGTLYIGQGVPVHEIPKLFVPHSKDMRYYSSSKQLQLYVDIDFTDCLPGYRYTLDWYNTPEDDELKQMYPDAATWAEAINEKYDIASINLTFRIYGLKSGIEFMVPASLFALETNVLKQGNAFLYSKDEDKYAETPISSQYNEYIDETKTYAFTNNVGGYWQDADAILLDLYYSLKASGPVVTSTWGW